MSYDNKHTGSYDNKQTGRRRNCAADRWARAFGISTERLAALIKEVSEQRQAPVNGRRPSRQDHRHRPAGGRPD